VHTVPGISARVIVRDEYADHVCNKLKFICRVLNSENIEGIAFSYLSWTYSKAVLTQLYTVPGISTMTVGL